MAVVIATRPVDAVGHAVRIHSRRMHSTSRPKRTCRNQRPYKVDLSQCSNPQGINL